MRKISITPEIAKLVKDKYADAIHNSRFHRGIVNELTSLRDEFVAAQTIEIDTGTSQNPNWIVSPHRAHDYYAYVEEVLQDYNSKLLLTWQPMAFLGVAAHKDALVNHSVVGCDMRIDGRPKGSLANRIVAALHYKNVRDKVIPRIYRKLELKACVYCNANYTISDEDGEGYYDLDHWKPKSLYPYLAISFFNLQPSCPSCNRRKLDSNDAFFGLWDDTNSDTRDVLRFKLDESSLVNYLVFLKRELLKVELVAANPWNQEQQTIRDNTEGRMNIEARYAEHNDFTEEIVWKSKIYNASMIQSLRDAQFASLIPTPADLERFVLGTYADPEDLHKRPLTRLAIDVARQLGLIMR